MKTPEQQSAIYRKAHELSRFHGQRAYLYAAKLAEEARVDGKFEEYEYWKSVSDTVRPRGYSSGLSP